MLRCTAGVGWSWCVVGGCVCCALGLCMGESSDGLLVAWLHFLQCAELAVC